MNTQVTSTNPAGRRHQQAFTMVEIAISLGVIVFALVAIIGVLPLGLNVQQENREDTIINQEGSYFMEAIRGGAHGLDRLTSYVDSITVSNKDEVTIYTNSAAYRPPKGIGPRTRMDGTMTNGEIIVALLTTPKYPYGFNPPVVINEVTARVRALTGGAAEQSARSKDLAFSYSMVCDVVPFASFPNDATNYTAYKRGSDEYNARYERSLEARQLGGNVYANGKFYPSGNLYDVRLLLRWPLYPNGKTGNRRHSFHTLVSAQQRQQAKNQPGPLFQPQTYTYIPTNSP